MIIEELENNLGEISGVTLVDRFFSALSGLPFPFLLQSGEGEPLDVNRFSFVGADPFMTIKEEGGSLIVRSGEHDGRFTDDPIKIISEIMDEFREEPHPDFPFLGGAVGYVAYEAGGLMEPMPKRKDDTFKIPDVYFCLYDTVMVFDHLNGRSFIASSGFPEKGPGKLKRAKERVDFFKGLISKPSEIDSASYKMGELTFNLKKEAYIKAVNKINAYIESGDIYQANLSQRFSAPFEGSTYSLYKSFMDINPVPFGAYLNYPELSVVSNSPERFLSLRDGRVETRPIKGTLRRSPSNDKALHEKEKNNLRMSRKDGAEHLMIVDLERNDLGRVCRYGTVEVKGLKRIESYSNLHHMVSTIAGELKEGIGPFDCIRAAFPGGSITGAPKVRAMEIIHEVEPNPRWLYTGSIGYIGFDGAMDMNIAIRTAFVTGGRVYFSVGGGIVADSDPESEYEETLLKGEVFSKIASYCEVDDE